MTEQNQNPEVTEDTEDTEGHVKRHFAADDPERADALADDTEGHARRAPADIDEEDEAEGHHFRR